MTPAQQKAKDRAQARKDALMPGGVPRYVRCYDGPSTFDRYTVLFTGRYAGRPTGRVAYVGMSADPFHPQGFGQHGEMHGAGDAPNGWPPKIGGSCHLGTRINFADLPEDCQRLVLSDYMELWNLK